MLVALEFGHKVIISVEIGISTYRTTYFNDKQNNEQIRENLDFLEERREKS